MKLTISAPEKNLGMEDEDVVSSLGCNDLVHIVCFQKGGGRGLSTADRATGRDRPVGRSPVGRAD